ncbi:hypothetical protein D3C78_1045350 [compost metagenome]
MGQQRNGVTGDNIGAQWVAVITVPFGRGGQRQQCHAKQGDKQQRGFQSGMQFTFRLPTDDRLQRTFALGVAKTLVHALLQYAVITHHLTQPQRGKPRVLAGDINKPLRQLGKCGHRIVGIGVKNAAGSEPHRHKTFVDQHIQQLFTVVKVVVQHGWCHAGLTGDGVE